MQKKFEGYSSNLLVVDLAIRTEVMLSLLRKIHQKESVLAACARPPAHLKNDWMTTARVIPFKKLGLNS